MTAIPDKTAADSQQIIAELERKLDERTSERDEALERQTATADILKVIASSPSDVQPVFEAIATSANRLIGGLSTAVHSLVDDTLHLTAFTPTSPAGDAALQARFPRPLSALPWGEQMRNGELVHIPDVEVEGAMLPDLRDLARMRGFRSMLRVPLLRDRAPIGFINVTRVEPGMFAAHHVQLLQTFADQAVIAIENTRLFNETKEALERQTATADILKVIASSPSDVQPVFEAIATSANGLIGGHSTGVLRFVDGVSHLSAFTPTNPAADEALEASFPRPLAEFPPFELVREGEAAQVIDTEFESGVRDLARLRGYRSMLFAPLMSNGVPIGLIGVTRTDPGSFADHHVQLLQTFADQAVIAIENVRLFNETRETLERQTATADILKVIASSPSDVQPVFEAIATSANRLLGGFSTAVFRFVEGVSHLAAFTPTIPAADEILKASFPRPVAEFQPFELAQAGEIGQIVDTETSTELRVRDIARARGFRSMLFAPLMSKGTPIGLISVTRVEPGSFAAHHVQLLQTFADQAVIAIENVRLFDEVQAKTRELEEALTYQTGSSNILGVIASSPTDVAPVLEAIVKSACELCDAYDATVALKDGDDLRFSAHHGPITIGLEKWPINRNWTAGRAFLDQRPVHVRDLQSDEDFPEGRELSLRMGHRSILSVPLLREGESIGAIVLRRTEVHPFSDKQIALLQTFADQAVIAIGNVRLFDEVQAKTRDLTESLEQQTATSEVLEVISSSPGELQPVFQKMLENATRACEATFGIMNLWDGEKFNIVADHNIPPAFAAYRQDTALRPLPGTSLAEVIRTHRAAQIRDLRESPTYLTGGPMAVRMADVAGARTLMAVPMLKDDELVGAITIFRQEVRPFSDKQIALVENFTKQAVIAIENTRLLKELRQRTDDLSESLQQQTATSEILGVISSSPGDLAPVFDAMLSKAMDLCGANFGVLNTFDGKLFRTSATYGLPPAYDEYRRSRTLEYGPGTAPARLLEGEPYVEFVDLLESEAYRAGEPNRRALVDIGGARSLLTVPLLKDGRVVGNVMIFRQDPLRFSDKQIALLKQFAAQAVIAIENARLLNELRQRTDDLTESLHDLRTAQDRLIQTEKLASLGQLTAGIAHEIKNPLNFVNNFSALSAELTDELSEVLKPVTLDSKVRVEVDELTGLLKDNLEKVVQHGKRADSIVKNMLLHSREGSREHRSADINSLLDESLNLAYHGARAEKGEFNITLQREFDADAGTIELFPQEITRAFLNLIANGVYAATKRKNEDKEPGFEPTLRATTKNLGTTVEIRIHDNGTGIPAEVQEKMFNPFFTTKPAGEGTGLGLSMTHDIIVKQHGGRIDVATEPGQFTEFTIVLPRKSNLSGSDRGKT
jgi:GAF domain-containing protein